jgi:hypothetical protein
MSRFTLEQQDKLCLAQAERIVNYLKQKGIKSPEQRDAILLFDRAWEKLSLVPSFDAALEQRLIEKDGLVEKLFPSKPMAAPLQVASYASKMAYLWQLSNPVAPYGTCNVTAIAMCLTGYGVKGSGISQLPEELRYWIEVQQGGDRHEPRDLVAACKWKGVDAVFREDFTLTEIIAALDEGRPVVLDGWFTPSGHFIVAKKYSPTTKKFLCLDPYGEWFNTGYQTGPNLGNEIEYSLNMIISACISMTAWADASSWPKDPMTSKTYAAIVFPK